MGLFLLPKFVIEKLPSSPENDARKAITIGTANKSAFCQMIVPIHQESLGFKTLKAKETVLMTNSKTIPGQRKVL